MRKIGFIFTLFSLITSPLVAQCGGDDGQINITSQSQLEAITGCEIIQGDLILSSLNITDLSPISSLTVVNGNFHLLNTAVTDLSPLSSLNNAVQVLFQGNTSLTSCCEFLQFIEAAELGAIMNVSFSNNGNLCDDMEAIMLDCLGYVEGCIDSMALNFNVQASVDDGACEYSCPESIDDIIDYSCGGEAYPDNCQIQIINAPSDGGGHYNNPIGLCYEESPPSSGPHRPMWGRWGEYEYLPPQRYLHNLEHGGIALLYHPCVEQAIIDSLRTLVCSRSEDEGGGFRWVMTPYPNLPVNIAAVAWEWTYLNDCFDANSINEFIDKHYRNTPEDFYYNGSYNTLYAGKCEAYSCTDENALNFESVDLIDDGSCVYPDLDTQVVVLNEGWSLFSTYIEPLNDSMSVVFQDIYEQTIIVKNNIGSAFLPNWDIDINLENGQGYQVKVSSNSVLEVTGTQLLPELTPIELGSGWNIIAYLREEPADVILVFEDIMEHVIMVKNGMGQVYFPNWGFNNIGDMQPGEGYQLKVSAPATLQYLANDQEY
ncbi:MAG: DUF3105 domain-containing protein [Flavobacteriales bacterium]|nr:DUF3105 domain-containing protein [Flavobacteriales bacterium]